MSDASVPSIGMRDDFLRFDRIIPFRISALAGHMTRALGRVYAETSFQLLAPEWRILSALGRFGAMAASDLRARTDMDNVRVSRAISSLLERGYIRRETDPFDRRHSLLRPTVTGEAIYTEIAPRIEAAEAEILASLTDEERTSLKTIISKLERQMADILPFEDEGSRDE
ncbi:MAG TPA: MarR family winged helix-turn-helix transcriptional regulator [Stellaceae bacterium]|jgi:DNA-binding MarR family transcriptional regulator